MVIQILSRGICTDVHGKDNGEEWVVVHDSFIDDEQVFNKCNVVRKLFEGEIRIATGGLMYSKRNELKEVNFCDLHDDVQLKVAELCISKGEIK
jgi:hypothetical protein